jgi:glyoxylase-like metal-dependent hydrolase (beta-lactamase superfamily II)
MELCPNAKLLAHPRAVPHLSDPSKLVKSAQEVYGEARFQELYGKIEPIDASRIQAMNDGEVLKWRGAELGFLHTRGHANHHFCIVLSELGKAQAIFTGDSFGLAYPDLQSHGLFIFPSTSPTDFNADEARKSIRRILDSGAPLAYLTHFGAVHDLPGASKQLMEGIDFSERLLKDAAESSLPDDQLGKFCDERIRQHFSLLLAKRGVRFDEKAKKLLDLDLELNADGIAHVARKNRSKGTLK